MSKRWALTLALGVSSLCSARGASDVAALFQRSVVKHGGGPNRTFHIGQRVEIEGYGPDKNVTVVGYGTTFDRYHLIMEGQGVYMNQQERFLKAWKPPYQPSTDREAGPVKYVVGFKRGKEPPYIVKRGELPGTWDVYMPGDGMIKNIPDGDIIRNKEWYQNRGHWEKSHNGAAAILNGQIPAKLYREQAKVAPIAEPEKPAATHHKAHSESSGKTVHKGDRKPEHEQEASAKKSTTTVHKKKSHKSHTTASHASASHASASHASASHASASHASASHVSAAHSSTKHSSTKHSKANHTSASHASHASASHASASHAPASHASAAHTSATHKKTHKKSHKKPAVPAQAVSMERQVDEGELQEAQEEAERASDALEQNLDLAQDLEDEVVAEDKLIAEAPEATPELKGSQKFVVITPDSAGKLGFTTKYLKSDGKYRYKEEVLVVDSISPGGGAEAWSRTNPRAKLNVGDRIMEVNGHGGNPHTLSKYLAALSAQPADPSAPPQTVKLLVDKLTKPAGQVSSEILDTVKQVMAKGPKGYLREALPYGVGKIFINSNEVVTKCGHITSPLLCGQSQERYNLTCAGWSGTNCLAKEDVACDKLTTASACQASLDKFGITCAGWGGSSCLTKDAHPSAITSESACSHAEERLGIKAAGWGGDKCLARDAKCSEITVPGICNSAQGKLGMSCLGWGGSSCLDQGVSAELITSESLCKRAFEKFGIEAAGWSGSSCLDKKAVSCSSVTDPSICNHARDRLGIDCAGWGGSSCLDVGSTPDLITSASICAKSMDLLRIQSGGWSGSACLPVGGAKCSAITHPGVCNDAAARLGLDCAGWSGAECLAHEDAKCNRVTVKAVCEKSMIKLGIQCVWNGDECLPDSR